REHDRTHGEEEHRRAEADPRLRVMGVREDVLQGDQGGDSHGPEPHPGHEHLALPTDLQRARVRPLPEERQEIASTFPFGCGHCLGYSLITSNVPFSLYLCAKSWKTLRGVGRAYPAGWPPMRPPPMSATKRRDAGSD